MSKQIQIASKFEPLFELLDDETYKEVDTVILTGGRACFYANQKVILNNGSKDISLIKKGDIVMSYNETSNKKEFKKVKEVFKYSNNRLLKIKLKNGTLIKVTEDHKFYHNGGWVCIKDLLSLWYGNMEKDK